MKTVNIITIISIIFSGIFSSVSFAVPSLTIHSPQNTTYSEHGPILINVTSNETVDFYKVNVKTGKKALVENSSNSLVTNHYGSRGTFNFTIYANNSNGEITKSIVFTINHSSEINVTTCGFLASSNTTYVIRNDLQGDRFCLILEASSRDSTVNLNGFTVSAQFAFTANCHNSEIINGKLIASSIGLDFQEGTKCRIKNVAIETENGVGIMTQFFYSSLLQNVTVKNVTDGIYLFEPSTDIFIKNSTLTTNKEGSRAINFETFDSVITLENSNVTNFTDNILFNGVGNVDFYMRNNDMNLSSVSQDSSIQGRVRLFKEHLLKINTTDDKGNPIAASVEISDNGAFTRTNREENTYTFNSNPSGKIFIGTDETGKAETFVTERLITVATASPPVFNEVSFSPYTLTARAALAVNQLLNVSVILNSTIVSNFILNTSSGGSSLPTCTVDQMLDLDNNGVINSKDAQIILRKMVGHNVTVNGTKECNAINFFPV